MKLLLVAAEPREFAGLLGRCSGVETVNLGLDWSRRARLNTHDLLLAANGARHARAGAAVDAVMAAGGVDAVISTGFCGALDPALGVGEVFVASEIDAPGRRFAAVRPGSGRPHAAGRLASIDRIAVTAAEKARLRQSGSAAVEMEAAGVAAAAEKWALPLYCVRAVTDLAGESFAIDFNTALRSDGHFDTMHILGAAVRKPMVALPELWRLRYRCGVAARNLGEFFADCRF